MSPAARALRREAVAPAGTWSVDASRSRVRFAVKHMLVSTVRGGFGRFEGTLVVGRDGSASGNGSVEAASFETGDAGRDERMRAELLDVARHPRITFASKRIEARGGRLSVAGELTMRGVTRELHLDGRVRAGRGGEPALELSGELDRKDYGITWSEALDAGGALVGETVKLELELRLQRAAGSARAPEA